MIRPLGDAGVGVDMTGHGDGQPLGSPARARPAQGIEGQGIGVIVAEHDDHAWPVLLDEPEQRGALVRGAGWSELERATAARADENATGIDGVRGRHDAGASGLDVRRSPEMEGQRRSLGLDDQPGLSDGLWHLAPEVLGHGDLGRAGRLSLDLERAGPEAAWGRGPLGAVVAEVTDAADTSPAGQVEHGTSGEKRDLHALGDRQPSQGASGSRDDGGSPRIGHQARERAVEVTGHEDGTIPREREDAPREPRCRDREPILRSQRRPPPRRPRRYPR